MSEIQTVARKDFMDALRSRMLWGTVGLMVALVTLSWVTTPSEFVSQIDRPLLTAVAPFKQWIPLVGIVLGYRSVVHERESGRIRVLLGASGTRRDVVVGKYLGRASVLLVALAVSVAAITALVSIQAGVVDGVALVGSVVLVGLYGFAWVGLTVGVSSAVSTSTRAVGVLVGLYGLFGPLWQTVVVPVLALVFTGQASLQGVDTTTGLTYLDGPTWYVYATRLNPIEAFDGVQYYLTDLIEMVVHGSATTAPHLPNLFGVAVLAGWAILPVVGGYWRFERADLG